MMGSDGVILTGGVYPAGGATQYNIWLQGRHTSLAPSSAVYNIVLEPLGGKVGIGATSPLVRLDARGSNAKATTAAFDNVFEVASTDATDPLALRAGIKTDATAGDRYGAMEVDDAGTKRPLALQASGGNVGIGTTDPKRPRHVKGGDAIVEEGGGFGLLEPGQSDPTTVLYRPGQGAAEEPYEGEDITILRTYRNAYYHTVSPPDPSPDKYTILTLWAPPETSTFPSPDREATLSLLRADTQTPQNSEFLDLYNNYYPAGTNPETQYGIRVQKRGNGVYRDFVFDQAKSASNADKKLIMVLRATRKVGVGTRTTPAKLSVKGESFTATGTVSVTANSNAVTGTGTIFTQEVDVGDKIAVSGTPPETRTVTVVSDETHLTVDSNFSNAHTNATMTVINHLLRIEDASGNAKVLVNDQGNVGIGTATPANILTVVQSSATDPIADAWTTYSSRRWKTNILPLEGALEKVLRLRAVSYERKDDGKRQIGVIGEEVGEVVPEVVAYGENGRDAKSVDYARLTALLIEAIKEQQAQLRELRRQLDARKDVTERGPAAATA